MFRIKTLNNISDLIYEHLTEDTYTVSTALEDPDAVLVRSASMHEGPLPPSLLAIARAGAGVNNIPVDVCTDQGIIVFNTPGANANAVKELVLAALLLSSRKVVEGIQWVKSLEEPGSALSKTIEKGKSNFTGPEIKGKKLGVIGLGAIGVMVANDARAIGMEVIGYDPYISVQSAWGLSRAVQKAPNLDALLSESDYLTIHVPLMKETRNFVCKETLDKMKPGLRLMNFSRGELVSTPDLLAAFDAGIVARYVTDFPDDALLHHPNVIPIPHLGASTPESEDNCASMASHQLRLFLETGSILNSVNYPECEMPKTEKVRITVAHKNIPNMVSQITSKLAAYSINIADMINKSHGSAAYTMIDIDGSAPADIQQQLMQVIGVIRVRIIP